MNAHTPIHALAGPAQIQQARELISDLETPIDRIKRLAGCACWVIDASLGGSGPAGELYVLLTLIEELATAAEARRDEAWRLLGRQEGEGRPG